MIIRISKPYLVNETSHNCVRLSADIEADGDCFTLWYEVEEDYAQYLTTERCDSFVVVLLPWAMMKAKKLKQSITLLCEGYVSGKLWHHLTYYYIPILSRKISYYASVDIKAETSSETLPSKKGVCASISGGLDSFYTITKYMKHPVVAYQLTHVLFCDYGLYGFNIGSEADLKVVAKTERIAHIAGLEYVKINSNVIQALYRAGHGPIVPAIITSTVLSLQKLISVFHYSSADPAWAFQMNEEQAACYDLLNLYCIGTENTDFCLSGMEVTRLDKAAYVADSSLVQENLLVCETQVNAENCSICANCTHTMAEFEVLGKLDLFSRVFDVNAFRKNAGYYWGYMVLKSKGSETGLYVEETKDILNLYAKRYGRFSLKVYWAAFMKWIKRGFTTQNTSRRKVENEVR